MNGALFVSNGHGEIAISDRIARELHALSPDLEIDHLALVGDIPSAYARDVGPRRSMPSGGLIAMGNVQNIVRDLWAGLFQLSVSQRRFLRRARGRYGVVVTVGDTFALAMALAVRAPTVYVGTAKSIYVAPYGRFEERMLKRATAIFVRDEATASFLRAHGVPAESPGNTIVDLFNDSPAQLPAEATAGFERVAALLPGSREDAYDEGVFLTAVFTKVARNRSGLGAILSIAPGINAKRMLSALRDAGNDTRVASSASVPFEVVSEGRPIVRAWQGDVAAILARAAVALGQAGTANEAAAAAGMPVVAFDRGVDRVHPSYRRRQAKLLGDALVTASGEASLAAETVAALIDDPQRCTRLGAIGRERMGPAGGSRRIAERIASLARPGSR